MQQIANYESVINACEQLQHNGQKVTGRAVVAITGGSLGTVLSYIKQWRQGASCTSPATYPEIPADLQASIIRALTMAQEQVKEKLANDTEQAAAREAEALEGLAAAEKHIEKLVDQIADIAQQLIETRQAAETAAAIAEEKTTTMKTRIEDLENERRQLIESAESARTESVKAMLQVERADQATAKAEKRLQETEIQFAAIQQQKIEAEKRAALAEQKNQLQADTLAEARESLAEVKKEKMEAITEKKQTIKTLEKQIATLLTEKAETGYNRSNPPGQ